MEDRTTVLLAGLRNVLIELIAILEDYLRITYNTSALYRRRTKRQEIHSGRKET
jgi:hypothetical protein